MNISILTQRICPRGLYANPVRLKTTCRPTLVKTLQKLRNSHPPQEMSRSQYFKNILVLDFEATCSRYPPQPMPQEIIEFPVLNIDTSTFEVISKFHTYVQPDVHKQLSSFCTELTGIIQEMVDDQPSLKKVLEDFDVWMEQQNLKNDRTAFITCGDWDLRKMLPSQCASLGIEVPHYMRTYINVKQSFYDVTGDWPKGLRGALYKCGITPSGRQHSGIDDCINLAKLTRWLAHQGYQFRITST